MDTKSIYSLTAAATLLSASVSRATDALRHLQPLRPLASSNGKANIGYRSCDRNHFSATNSRHTGRPYEHKREIARNARQAAA